MQEVTGLAAHSDCHLCTGREGALIDKCLLDLGTMFIDHLPECTENTCQSYKVSMEPVMLFVTRVDAARTSMAAMTALEEHRFSVKEEADTV